MSLRISPAWAIAQIRSIDWIHRSDEGAEDAEIYFLANRRARVESVTCDFRVDGKLPELWNPVTGETRPAASYSITAGKTCLRLTLAPYESLFVVFRNPAAAAKAEGSNFAELTGGAGTARSVDGGVRSAMGRSARRPSSHELVSWTKRPEEGIKFYSGTATYQTRFDLPDARTTDCLQRIYLDLGEVRNLAEVRLNGKDLGIVWTAPWRVDITGAVRPGENVLEIRVVNLWPNRLIGDAALPKEKRLTSTNLPFDKNQPLLDSGLLGPVKVMVEP